MFWEGQLETQSNGKNSFEWFVMNLVRLYPLGGLFCVEDLSVLACSLFPIHQQVVDYWNK